MLNQVVSIDRNCTHTTERGARDDTPRVRAEVKRTIDRVCERYPNDCEAAEARERLAHTENIPSSRAGQVRQSRCNGLPTRGDVASSIAILVGGVIAGRTWQRRPHAR